MTRHLLAACAVLAALAPAPAHAATPPGDGLCGFGAVRDLLSADRVVGTFYGVVDLTDGDDLRTGRLTCSLQENAVAHSAPDLVSVTSVTMPGFAVLPPAHFTFEYDTYLTACLSVEIEGDGTYYWDEEEDAWSTDPESSCNFVFVGILPSEPHVDPVPIDPFLLDPVICPPLALLYPPQGDVVVAGVKVWDCPPYDL